MSGEIIGDIPQKRAIRGVVYELCSQHRLNGDAKEHEGGYKRMGYLTYLVKTKKIRYGEFPKQFWQYAVYVGPKKSKKKVRR